MEFEIDDDDEDALILANQPYETVMNIGYGHLLTHLRTKEYARRSDIIVSSTLSFTLTPKEGDFVSQVYFANITEEETKKWVDKRQEFRTLKVK